MHGQLHHNKSQSLSYTVSECVCEWETEMGQVRQGSDGDTWPPKQPRINCLHRKASPEGCGKVIMISTNRNAAIYLIFRIHTLMQLELPDVEPPVEKGAQIKSKKILPEN